MDLVYSLACIGLATVLAVLVILAVRRPVAPAWASEGLIANVWCVAITGLIGFGVSLGVRFALTIESQNVGTVEILLSVALLAGYSAILILMAPRRRLAEYARQSARAANAPASVAELTVTPSVEVTPADPTLPKAA
ncbi:MAG: hypothetical protein R3337_03325 [Gammaproteobacteria bacterium]|nr:hypothetical protein [Gammaproteobacteria bacterium]